MRRKWNRFVAGLLSIVLLVTMLPMEVLAAGNGGRAEQPSQTMPFQDESPRTGVPKLWSTSIPTAYSTAPQLPPLVPAAP